MYERRMLRRCSRRLIIALGLQNDHIAIMQRIERELNLLHQAHASTASTEQKEEEGTSQADATILLGWCGGGDATRFL